MTKILTIVLSVVLVLLVSCNNTEKTAHHLPTPVPGQLTMLDLMAPEAPTSTVNGAVYFTLQNGTDHAVQLRMTETTMAARTSFHETVNDNGVMRMLSQPDGFLIAPGESLVLAPGGKHLMLEELQAPLNAGDEFTLLFTFDGASPMTVTVPVIARGTTIPMNHSMMDHGK